MKVVLYTTGCPQCRVLKQKLDEKNIDYDVVTDTKEMIRKGFATVPMLEVDGKIKNCQQAMIWVNER